MLAGALPPLLAAAQAGRTDRVAELLDTGVGSALDVDASGQTALHKAALLGLHSMAQVTHPLSPADGMHVLLTACMSCSPHACLAWTLTVLTYLGIA
jgi:ankyrin repeat protein